MSWVPFVIRSGRSISGTSGERSICSIARHAWRTVYGSLTPITDRTVANVSFPSSLSRNAAPTACVVTWSEKSSHGIDSAIRRQTRNSVAPVDVGLRERDVGARRDHAIAVRRGEGDRDHPAHRRAVDEDAVERQRVEELRAVVGPALDRVPLPRAGRCPVAPRVEREQPEPALAEAVVHEAEVVASEEASAELDHDRPVVGPGQLVVQLDPVVDLRVRHSPAGVSRPRTGSVPAATDAVPGDVAREPLGVDPREQPLDLPAAALRARWRRASSTSRGTPRTALRTSHTGTRRSA